VNFVDFFSGFVVFVSPELAGFVELLLYLLLVLLFFSAGFCNNAVSRYQKGKRRMFFVTPTPATS